MRARTACMWSTLVAQDRNEAIVSLTDLAMTRARNARRRTKLMALNRDAAIVDATDVNVTETTVCLRHAPMAQEGDEAKADEV